MSETRPAGSWKGRFARLAGRLDQGLDAVKYRFAGRFDRDDPLQILPYRGYGTGERLFLQGRVLEDERVGTASEQDSPWTNLAKHLEAPGERRGAGKAHEAPGREAEVLEIAKEVRTLGTAMPLVADTEAAAVHAAENGWIRREQVPEVQKEKEKAKDETAPSPVEAALDPAGSASTDRPL